MSVQPTFQNEMEDWQARFHGSVSYPRKAVTVTFPRQRLVAHYESGGVPSVYAMRQTARERIYGRGLESPDVFVGRSLRGSALGRFYFLRHIESNPAGLSLVSVASAIFAPLARNQREEERARAFAEELIDHWETFDPASPLPGEVVEVTSADRRITVVYDPELGDETSPPQRPFNAHVYIKGDEYSGRFSRF